jgi:hypothetical protein
MFGDLPERRKTIALRKCVMDGFPFLPEVKRMFSIQNVDLVRLAGLEPARVAPLPPQSSVSANSTISAADSYIAAPSAVCKCIFCNTASAVAAVRVAAWAKIVSAFSVAQTRGRRWEALDLPAGMAARLRKEIIASISPISKAIQSVPAATRRLTPGANHGSLFGSLYAIIMP